MEGERVGRGAWKRSGGEEGLGPPEDVTARWQLAEACLQQEMGSDESNRIGKEIATIQLDNYIKIGTVGDIVGPYVYRNDLQNVREQTAKSYDFYWTYPYRPQQWWMKK